MRMRNRPEPPATRFHILECGQHFGGIHCIPAWGGIQIGPGIEAGGLSEAVLSQWRNGHKSYSLRRRGSAEVKEDMLTDVVRHPQSCWRSRLVQINHLLVSGSTTPPVVPPLGTVHSKSSPPAACAAVAAAAF